MLTPKRCVCGQVIVFVQDAANPEVTHPLDVSSAPHVYQLEWGEQGPRAVKQAQRGLPIGPGAPGPMLVSHFRTCSKVREFASKRREIEDGPAV